jgi:hypothetical protein
VSRLNFHRSFTAFSASNANKTVRIDVKWTFEKVELISAEPLETFNPCSGIFGRREPQLTEDNLINRSFEKRQISMKQTNESNFKQT